MSSVEVKNIPTKPDLTLILGNPLFQKLLGKSRLDFVMQDLSKKGGIFEEETHERRINQSVTTQSWRFDATDGYDTINKMVVTTEGAVTSIEIKHDFLHKGEGADEFTQVKIRINPPHIEIETYTTLDNVAPRNREPFIGAWNDPDILPYVEKLSPRSDVVETMAVQIDNMDLYKALVTVTDKDAIMLNGVRVEDNEVPPEPYYEAQTLTIRSENNGAGAVKKTITAKKILVETRNFVSS